MEWNTSATSSSSGAPHWNGHIPQPCYDNVLPTRDSWAAPWSRWLDATAPGYTCSTVAAGPMTFDTATAWVVSNPEEPCNAYGCCNMNSGGSSNAVVILTPVNVTWALGHPAVMAGGMVGSIANGMPGSMPCGMPGNMASDVPNNMTINMPSSMPNMMNGLPGIEGVLGRGIQSSPASAVPESSPQVQSMMNPQVSPSAANYNTRTSGQSAVMACGMPIGMSGSMPSGMRIDMASGMLGSMSGHMPNTPNGVPRMQGGSGHGMQMPVVMQCSPPQMQPRMDQHDSASRPRGSTSRLNHLVPERTVNHEHIIDEPRLDSYSDCIERESCCSTRASTAPERGPSNRLHRRGGARRTWKRDGNGNSSASSAQSRTRDAPEGTLNALRGSVWRLSLLPDGCRTVQDALRSLDKRGAEELVLELHGHVREAIQSPHANYVIQKVIEQLPIPKLGFILDEMSGTASTASRHRYGCRIVCRLLEHAGSDQATAPLIEEVLSEVGPLSRHVFGHHVIHAVLEHGLPKHKSRIVYDLQQDIVRNAMSRSGSYVIERALQHCTNEDCDALANALLSISVGVGTLVQNLYGCYIVKALLRFPGPHAATAMGQLRTAAPQLQANKCGRRLLQDLVLLDIDILAAPGPMDQAS